MFQKIKEYKSAPYIIIAVLGILICIPYCTKDLISDNEFRLHIIRITAIKELMSDGVFPPLISYKYMLGFGYGINIFYGAICTYIPILISFITHSQAIAIKVYTIFTVIFSGITMYLFALKVTNRKRIALISALIYMFAPYKLTNIYVRHAIGEYTAFIFIPTFFEGIYALLNKGRKSLLYLVIGISGLILSHTITFIYSIIFGIVYIIINFKKVRNLFFLKTIGKAFIIVLALTCFYTVPILEHKFAADYTIFNEDVMKTSGEAVYANTNKIVDWIKLKLSYDGDFDFSFGIPATILLLLVVAVFKKIDKNYEYTYWTFWGLGLVSLFMCTKAFPWKVMPQIIFVIQFAWRLNGFFIFFAALICGINAYHFSKLFKKREDTIFVMIVLLTAWISIMSVFGLIRNEGDTESNNYEKTLIENSKFGVYQVVRDYMPDKAYMIRDTLNERGDKTIILAGDANIISEEKYRLTDTIEVEMSGETELELELPYLYYCGYTTTLNGEKIKNYESENGFIAVKINKSGTLEIKYTGTILEKISYLISIICFISVIGYTVMKNRRKEEK